MCGAACLLRGHGSKELQASSSSIPGLARLAEEEDVALTDDEAVFQKESVEEEEGVAEEREKKDKEEIALPERTEEIAEQKHKQPDFPSLPDSMVTDKDQRRADLEKWLQEFLHFPINRNHQKTCRFLEVSRWSFVSELGGKHREGAVRKKPGGARVCYNCSLVFTDFMPWRKRLAFASERRGRWLVLKDTYVTYIDPDNEWVRLVILVDPKFRVDVGLHETDKEKGLFLTNLQ